jgi:hypothetical protein
MPSFPLSQNFEYNYHILTQAGEITMPDQIQLKLTINPTSQTDAEELDRLTRQLRQEILGLDVEDVAPVKAEGVPEGSKGDAFALGALLITTLASSGAFPYIFDLLKTWLTRHGLRSVTLEIDGDTLEVKGVSAEEQKQLIDAWMSRHKLILTP